MSERKTATIDITLAGETRTVEFYYWLNSEGTPWAGTTEPVFTAQIGRGAKRHATGADLICFESEERARRMGYRVGETYRPASDGRWWAIKVSTTVLNRQARITGWRDAQPHTSRHIMERASHEPQVSA